MPVPGSLFPRAPQAVVFDMDGLIIDTEVLYRDAFMAVAAERGLDLPHPVFLSLIGLPPESSRKILRGHFGSDFALEPLLDIVRARFLDMSRTGLRLKPGVVELLDFLDEIALPKAIATSSPHEAVHHHLTMLGVFDRFPTVIARGDYDRGKPDPQPFLKAAEALRMDPALCVALEDSSNGVMAASGAGMMTIMVPDLIEPTDRLRALALHVAGDLHEVRGLISDRLSGFSLAG